MLDAKHVCIYETLWLAEDGRGPRCDAIYVPPMRFYANKIYEPAAFIPPDEEIAHDAAIWISRSPVPKAWMRPDPSGADFDELLALAHERGHELRFRRGLYDPIAIDLATWVQALPEEECAWAAARELLHELEFDEWDRFEKGKSSALRPYVHNAKVAPTLRCRPR